MIEIYYNGANPFTGIPTPLVSRSTQMVEFNQRWGQLHSFGLNGVITGDCSTTFAQMLARKDQILSGFAQDYKTLEFYSGGVSFTGFPDCKLESISFDAHNYARGVLPFQVKLSQFPSGYFSGTFGILDPKEQFSFQESEDGSLRVTHSTSAKGFCTTAGTTNALDNAKNWVAARTGWSSQVLPAYASGVTGGLCLQTLRESYDRLNASYEVVETYLGDRYYGISNGFIRYASSVNSGEDGMSSVGINGSIRNCKYATIDDLRTKYAAFNAFDVAAQDYYKILGATDLNPTPVSKSVGESLNGSLLSFSYLWNNDTRGPITFDTKLDYGYSFAEDLIDTSVSVSVSSKNPFDSGRWTLVLAAANTVNLYSIAQSGYAEFASVVSPHLASTPLNTLETSSSRSENEFATTVTLQASYNNASNPPYGLEGFNSNISITPALNRYSAAPILDGTGGYYLFDLGFKSRASLDVEVDGIGAQSTTTSAVADILKSEVSNLRLDYFAGTEPLLESQSITTGNASFSNKVSVKANFSADQSAFLV